MSVVFKNLCFVVEKRMAARVQSQNFAFRCKKANDRLGTTAKILYFALKKRMAIGVHALLHDYEYFLITVLLVRTKYTSMKKFAFLLRLIVVIFCGKPIAAF